MGTSGTCMISTMQTTPSVGWVNWTQYMPFTGLTQHIVCKVTGIFFQVLVLIILETIIACLHASVRSLDLNKRHLRINF